MACARIRRRSIYVHHTVNDASESHDSMVVFDHEGKFVKSWGKEFQGGAHGLHIRKEGSQEFLYLCDTKRAIVVKTTLDGEEVFTLGYPKESEFYKLDKDGKPATKYSPTNLAIAPNGDIYVGDGYGSSYINQYNSKGEFIRTFGGKGKDPGQLDCPHGITVDLRGPQPLLLVADRANARLQYFTLDGKHAGFVGGVNLPCHFSERHGEFVIPDLGARVTLMDRENKVIDTLGRRQRGQDLGRSAQADARSFHAGQVCVSARRVLRSRGEHFGGGVGGGGAGEQAAEGGVKVSARLPGGAGEHPSLARRAGVPLSVPRSGRSALAATNRNGGRYSRANRSGERCSRGCRPERPRSACRWLERSGLHLPLV